jgi:hypothetical protein
MAIRLKRNQIQLLKELAAASEHGRSIAASASSIEIAHLIGTLHIGPENVVPKTKFAFFAHANAICALRNDPTFDLAQSSRTEILLVLGRGNVVALEGADNVTRRS